jgi:peptidyl-tRNA hydrolase, PTH1 family
MLLLVGLGNPGPGYAKNRHNLGFMAVDEIVRRHGFGPFRRRFQSDIAEGRIGAEKLLAQKPLQYMNRSGLPVKSAADFYKLAPDEIVVIYDEIDLVPGKVRVKKGGGHGGHNGIRDIARHIGADFWRVRLGVGHPGDKDRVEGWVLQDVPKADWPLLERVIDAVAEELPLLVGGDDGAFMSKVAHRVNPPKPKAHEDKPKAQPEAKDITPKAGPEAETHGTETGGGPKSAASSAPRAGGLKAALEAARHRFASKKPGGDGV